MLSTRRLVCGERGSLGTGLLTGVLSLLVTSCEGAPSIGNLAAAGGRSEELGAMEAGAVGGGLAAAAGGGPLAVGGGGGLGANPRHEAQLSAAGSGGGSGSGNGSHGSKDPEPNRYPGQGFIVHEWGTDTIVVGSDGSLQRGLHHEEEDLPSFVYDRIKAGILLGSKPSPSVMVKMETPVTYFYSPTALPVTASVAFPKGVLTQWYPAVIGFLPGLGMPPNVTSTALDLLGDPALDANFPFVREMCRLKFGSVSGGQLQWGSISVQARGTTPEQAPPSAPLEQFGWSYARAVDANLLTMPNGESERFLFYRGLGEFDLPVKVQDDSGAKVKLTNNYSEAVGHVFLLNVSQDQGAFSEHASGIASGATLEGTIPSLVGAPGLDEYATRLYDAVTRALDATGLYHDEAIAMVNTWRRQWFRTPGVRALYLVPQSWTEQSIPLTISPKPDSTVRVMLIRVELIRKELEAADVSALAAFDTDSASGAAYFSKLGRFAEPRLRRALQLSPSAAAEQYLAQIASAKSSVMSGE